MNDNEFWNIIQALQGHAKWLRNYDADPKKYHNPVPMTPDQLDKIAERLSTLSGERIAHKVMTPEEYAAMPLKGWHQVCRDVDGFGGVGIRYLGEPLRHPEQGASDARPNRLTEVLR